MPMFCAAARDRSSTRPRINGPRSLTRTTTLRPLWLLVTLIFVPKARERCAAVSVAAFMRSPEAVLELPPYQDAPPHPFAADASNGWKEKAVAIVAATTKDRRIFFKSVSP